MLPILVTVVFLQKTSSQILDDCAKSLRDFGLYSVTSQRTYTSYGRKQQPTQKLFVYKDRAFHGVADDYEFFYTPTKAITIDRKLKQYRKKAGKYPLPDDYLGLVGVAMPRTNYRPVGVPTEVNWHDTSCLKIEIDGTFITRETKLFLYVAKEGNLPLGYTVNPGSFDAEVWYQKISPEPNLKREEVSFSPPVGWKEIK